MKSGNTREFLETIASQDAWLKWRERYFFVNGCCQETSEDGKVVASIGMYETDSCYQDWIRDICEIVRPSIEEAVDAFTRVKIIDGKTFWELENELEWQ